MLEFCGICHFFLYVVEVGVLGFCCWWYGGGVFLLGLSIMFVLLLLLLFVVDVGVDGVDVIYIIKKMTP